MKEYDAILTACFGTSDLERFKSSFLSIHNLIKCAHPNTPVHIAVTCKAVRHNLSRRHFYSTLSVEDVLDIFRSKGFRRILVVSLFIFDGGEWEKLKSICKKYAGYFDRISVTPPVLRSSLLLCARAISDLFPREKGTSLLLVGHGSTKFSNGQYLALLDGLKGMGREDISLSLVCGDVCSGGVKDILSSGSRRVLLIPLMFCYGHHAEDIFSHDGNLITLLEDNGFEIVVFKKGLGEIKSFQNLFVKSSLYLL